MRCPALQITLGIRDHNIHGIRDEADAERDGDVCEEDCGGVVDGPVVEYDLGSIRTVSGLLAVVEWEPKGFFG